MKPEEAIERLKYLESALDGYPPETGINDVFEAINTAIEALKEVQQYLEIGTVRELREIASIVRKAEKCELAKIIDEWIAYHKIGTVEECRKAAEKQKPKAPAVDKYHHTCCPSCGWVVAGDTGWGKEYLPHCENCGQAILWDKDLEETNDERD